MSVSFIFSALIDYSASDLSYLLRFAVFVAYVILTYSFILVLWFGGAFAEEKRISGKIGWVFVILVVLVFGAPLLFFFSWVFAILLLLIASLLSGASLVYPSGKSRARALVDLALFVLALILVFVLRTITVNEFIIPLATFISRIAVFWGVIEAARGFIYLTMTQTTAPARTATALLVALFGLSIFAQDIVGQSPLSLIAETFSDYAFIAGAVLAVLAFIMHCVRSLLGAFHEWAHGE